MNYSMLVFIGAVVSIVGAAVAGLGTLFASNQRAEFERQLRKKSEEISKKSDEIAIRNAEIAELNKQVAATLTGGDNYSYVQISPPAQNSHVCEVYLINRGDYPVYDVSVQITDVKRLLELSHVAPPTGSAMQMGQYLAQAVTAYPTLNIGPKKSLPLGMLQFRDSDTEQYKAYNVEITGKRSLSQEIRLRRAKEKWKYGDKRSIFGPGNSGPRREELIDPEFPRDEAGKVQWGP